MPCLSGFELYSRWVPPRSGIPLFTSLEAREALMETESAYNWTGVMIFVLCLRDQLLCDKL